MSILLSNGKGAHSLSRQAGEIAIARARDRIKHSVRDEEGHRRLFEGFLREYDVEGLAAD